MDLHEMEARKWCWYWDDDFHLRERFIDTDMALQSMGVPRCEFSNWEGTSPCRLPATKEVRVTCPNASGMRCCDDHYKASAMIPQLEGLIELQGG
jgi:hypothetical protein